METFCVTAQHSGAIKHIHAISLDASTANVAREIRLAVTVLIVGWVAVTGIRTWSASRRS
ncbi:uncharacterized protein B0I36DRAFT_317515 [Microdochium trichocladiopsis]|uniref:Uncharacterized protein n=1 Tax=Microdochium trichocladiopsis TaxID=1682393 RepID=A0A9P9BT26_9PEZI|nr:uncharacterized protein B0I36DRAFT_317515 [Microdochium trichocladiopsis]KAH7035057.1 hypothetical protein B0I36DRAFT_317515 [Microdochium trichocladiopsis]